MHDHQVFLIFLSVSIILLRVPSGKGHSTKGEPSLYGLGCAFCCSDQHRWGMTFGMAMAETLKIYMPWGAVRSYLPSSIDGNACILLVDVFPWCHKNENYLTLISKHQLWCVWVWTPDFSNFFKKFSSPKQNKNI